MNKLGVGETVEKLMLKQNQIKEKLFGSIYNQNKNISLPVSCVMFHYSWNILSLSRLIEDFPTAHMSNMFFSSKMLFI